MKVLHLVSENDRVNGYTLRTQRIVEAQRALGIDAQIVTPVRGQSTCDYADDILRSIYCQTDISPTDAMRLIPQCTQNAIELLTAVRHKDAYYPCCDVLHAHTPWWAGVAALCAQQVGLPGNQSVVYEVRGLQEDSAVADKRKDEHSEWYSIWRKMEDHVRREADHVFAISPFLAEDALARGARSVSLVPNGVDTKMFQPQTPEMRAAMRDIYQLGDGPIVGYFGSIRPLEGIDELIRAMPLLREAVPGIRVLIRGNGDARPLYALATELGVMDMLMLPIDAVEPEVIPRLLGAVDCVAITRPDSHVTRTVTPLKPLEALACGIPVVSSDLPALRFVGEAGTTFYPSGDIKALAERIAEAISRPRDLAGREWVERERSWEAVAKEHLRVYEGLIR